MTRDAYLTALGTAEADYNQRLTDGGLHDDEQDQANVILDALDVLRHQIDELGHAPWDSYDSE